MAAIAPNLLPATNISANGVGNAMTCPRDPLVVVQLLCSAVPTGGAPTLDVYLQSTIDGGTTWFDVAHIQFATSTANKMWRISQDAAGPTASEAMTDASLAGDTCHQGPMGDQFRLKYVFAAGGSTGTYTLSANFMAKRTA